ncbi:MAG: manganese efflux pump MntP family protein [Lachnospiraceae bacterium]
MDLGTVLVLAVALSMDAFAVSICKGLAMKKITIGKCLIVGMWFGGFQGLMPFIGFLLGSSFAGVIESVSAWIAFILLAIIGSNMVKESFSKSEEEENDSLKFKEMLLLAIATSIDALAVGITFACVPVTILNAGALINTFIACVIIACTTCVLSMAGVKVGNIFGTKYKNKAEFAGGVVLILIGLKIILEHFGIF